MKKVIKAASLLDKFLEYHDDENNMMGNESGFNRMYAILDKYDDSNGRDTVDIPFMKATPEDQRKMVELITPGPRRPGDKGYAQKLYYDALEGEYGKEYGRGMVDAIEALMAEGWINESEFRTDL